MKKELRSVVVVIFIIVISWGIVFGTISKFHGRERPVLISGREVTVILRNDHITSDLVFWLKCKNLYKKTLKEVPAFKAYMEPEPCSPCSQTGCTWGAEDSEGAYRELIIWLKTKKLFYAAQEDLNLVDPFTPNGY